LLREYDEMASKADYKDRSALLREFLKKVGV
jgi:metal-responsive CopG/Arc/MetJ family transcriptional regulator